MTREEAIQRIKDIRWEHATNSCPDREALNMAIEALSAEPCEDCISRKAALEPYRVLENTDTLCVALVRANLMQQPSVTSKPKIGRWEPGECNCPICGENKYKDLDADIWADWHPKFCPNCGAKMAESEDKE